MEKKKDNELFNFENVRVYQDENNVLHYNTRDVVRELGYERVHVDTRYSAPLKAVIELNDKDITKNKYTSSDMDSQVSPPVGGWGDLNYIEPRWDRVNNNLNKLGVPSLTEEQKNGYIPENLVYKLGFHARTQKAIHFQNLVSDQILPHFRQTTNQEELEEMRKKARKTEERLAMYEEFVDHRTNQYTNELIKSTRLEKQLKDTTDELNTARNLKYREELSNNRLCDKIIDIRNALEKASNILNKALEDSY